MINFPTSLDSLTNPTSSDTLNSPDHAAQHSNANDAVEALEAKVGADSSAVTTSHDYKLSGVTGTDKAVSKTGSETLTNKILTSPVVNLGSDGTGDMYYRNSGGAVARLPIGTAGQILDVSSGLLPEWVANPSAADASTTTKGVVEIATQAEADAGTASGGTTAPLVTRTSNVRVRNYNDYVVDTGSANAYAIAPVPAISAYADGQIFAFKAINANTTASTLAVNGLATKDIRKNYNNALVSGDILAGQRVLVIYDAANNIFQMLSPAITGQVPTIAHNTIADNTSVGYSTTPGTNTDTVVTHGLGKTPSLIRLGATLLSRGSSSGNFTTTGTILYDGYGNILEKFSTEWGTASTTRVGSTNLAHLTSQHSP